MLTGIIFLQTPGCKNRSQLPILGLEQATGRWLSSAYESNLHRILSWKTHLKATWLSRRTEPKHPGSSSEPGRLQNVDFRRQMKEIYIEFRHLRYILELPGFQGELSRSNQAPVTKISGSIPDPRVLK